MRDKLIELIKKGGVIIPETAQAVADYLIANKVFVLPENVGGNWELGVAFLMRLFVADEAKIEKIKQEFELQKIKKILTDIRDYLVTEKGRVANGDIYLLQIQAVEKFAEKSFDGITEYAEKLEVEL